MKSDGKLLLGLAIGVALGAAVGFIVGNDKRDEWFEQANQIADKLKANVKSAINKGRSSVDSLKGEIEDIRDIAKKELDKD